MKDAFFADYLERLENLQNGLKEAIQDLPPEAADWSPGPEMNSIGVLIAHTAGSLRYWIGDVVLDEPSGRVRAHEFQTRGLSGAELLPRLDAALDYARSALLRMRVEDLAQEIHTEEGDVFTRGWALLHALEHSYLHLGHIQLTAQFWKENQLH